MRSTGIRRKVDDLGRVVIPAGIRRSLDIREGDEVEVHVDGEHVVLSKPAVRCVFCGTEDAPLQTFRERQVCRGCVASVGVLDETLRERAREAATQTTASGWQPPAAVIEDSTEAAVTAPPEHDDRPEPTAAPAPTPTPDPAAATGRRSDPDAASPEPRRTSPTSHDDRSTEREDDPLYDPASTTAW